MQNLDKIAFVLVGIIVLGLSAYAVMFSGGANHSDTIRLHSQTIRSKENEQDVRSLGRQLPDFKEQIRSDFELGAARPFPEWSFYRRPAELAVTKTEVIRAAEHVAPRLTRVEVIRDAEKKRAVHQVSGELGDSKRVKGLRASLEAKAGDGDWAKVADLDATTPGAVFVEIVDDESGVAYSYRVRTEAESATQLPLSDVDRIKVSSASPAIAMPPNFSLTAGGAQPGQPGSGSAWQPGRANLKIRYYDHESGELKQDQKLHLERDLDAALESLPDVFPEVLGPGWKLFDISKEDRVSTVNLRNLNTREKMSLVNNAPGPELEVKPWVNADSGPGPEESAPTPGEKPSDAPPPDRPAPPKKSSNPFGDD